MLRACLLAGLSSIAIATVLLGWSGTESGDLALATEQEPTPTPTADPFAVAEKLASSGLFSDAVAAAKTAIAADPSRSLGPLTLAAIAASSPKPSPTASPTTDPFMVAESLAEAGLRSGAVEAAAAALKADPFRTLGPKASAILGDPFKEALGLAAAGFDEAALAAAKAWLQQHPASTLPPQLAYLTPSLLHDPSGPEFRYKAVGIFIQDVLVILTVALLGWVLFVLLQRIFVQRVAVRAFDEEEVKDAQKLGKTLAVVVEDELRRLKTEGGSSSLKTTRTPDAPLNIPDAVKQLPGQAGLVAALLTLIPNRVFGFAGTLHPEGELGVGLTAAITDPLGAVKASETFWEKTYDPIFKTSEPGKRKVPAVTAYRRLAIAAASWAIYQSPLVADGSPPPGYMSAEWRSYALHRVAASWDDDDDDNRAKQLYRQALERDPANWGTLLNLASLDEDDADGRARRIELLLEAQRLTQSQRADTPVDRSWHRVRFVLGIFCLEEDLLGPNVAGPMTWLDRAEQSAISVIAQANSDMRRPQTNDHRLFLTAMQDAAVTLLAGVWVRMKQPNSVPILGADLPEEFLEATAGKRRPAELIAVLEHRPGGFAALHADVRYDLACYFSLAGESDSANFDEALKHLRHGVKKIEEARKDLALKPLQRARTADFDEVLTRWAEDATQPRKPVVPLAKLPLIGPDIAERLAASGVETVEQLEVRTRTQREREQLAADVSVPFALVDAWVNVMRLRFLHGVGVDVTVASLLYAVGIRHADALATKDPTALIQLLRSENAARGIADQTPSTADVRSWIESARGAIG